MERVAGVEPAVFSLATRRLTSSTLPANWYRAEGLNLEASASPPTRFPVSLQLLRSAVGTITLGTSEACSRRISQVTCSATITSAKLVGATGLEPAWSWSQTRRVTEYPTLR